MEKPHDRAPRFDSGDVLGCMYNCIFRLRNKGQKLMDGEDAYIIGSGKYNGVQTTAWANEMMERLLYFSYRNRFVPLINGATTDASWGCMIRTGQMMLAHAFMRFFNGGNATFRAVDVQELRRRVQILFFDVPSSPFGIHAVTAEGVKHGVRCGRWFGPTPLAKTLSRLCMRYVESGGDGPAVLFIQERHINAQEVMSLLQQSRQVLLLIPAMLGINVISEKYGKLLALCLEMESSVGVVGGYRNSALFLCGHQRGNVFHLDPHYVQRALTSSDGERTLTSTAWQMFPTTQYDTSMALGFYITSVESFAVFEKDMTEANAHLTFPLISVSSAADETPAAASDAKCLLQEF